MPRFSRRNFLKTGVATGALVGVGNLHLFAQHASATDWVTLGKSDVKVTRLAFGTGTHNGHVQRHLGQDGFTRLVRYAYDHGIRFFETAQAYTGMPEMLGIALKGLPRESYALMSKVTTNGADPQTAIDEMRRQGQTEYFDIMLLHVQTGPTWPSDSLRWQDGILEMQHRKAVRSHGASVHGLPALRQVPGDKWLDVAMIRMNHKGVHMDNDGDAWNVPGNVAEVVEHVKQTRAAGMGVISMKLVGEGAFTDRADRQQSMRFAFEQAGVQCVTVGYKNTAEIDEAIENVNLAAA
ncbi:Oxidoreductase [Candidatus Sulfotelmatomonas gaucii]|uniref:Oxidoreductase n=1 Tax=Candidatus Sulfuritelmatomonas gaucii TaxID=2043161 RepID=A0A2N9LYW1_9BACT|nr:Oxidoreductase [Candidatus Sulfotelmatomonas gaucii]